MSYGENRGRLAYKWIPFKPNAAVPPGGVMVQNAANMADSDDTYVLYTRKPTCDGDRPLFINHIEICAADDYGICHRAFHPTWIAYYTSDGTPAAGERWGPVADSFYVRKNRPGFIILDAGGEGLVWALPEDDQSGERWFQLYEHLNANSSAAAYWVNWDTAGNGSYSVDLVATKATVKDLAKQHWGLQYEWVRCVAMPAVNGAQWEVVHSGAPWHRGLIYDEVCRDESVTVTLSVREQDAVEVTATNVFCEAGECLTPDASGMRVGITYNVWHETDGSPAPRWEITEAECS